MVTIPRKRRPRHPDKGIESLLREAEARGWTVIKRPRGYFKAYCVCDEKHQKWIHLTPSGTNYLKNQRKWFERQSCWEDDS